MSVIRQTISACSLSGSEVIGTEVVVVGAADELGGGLIKGSEAEHPRRKIKSSLISVSLWHKRK